MNTIAWWEAAAVMAAVLAGGAFRLDLIRNWMGYGAVVLLAMPAFFVGWQGRGWPIEGALGAAVGAVALGYILPDILREVTAGAIRLIRWLLPVVVGIVALGFALGTFGPDQVGKSLAILILTAIGYAVWRRSASRCPQRQNRR